MKENQHARRQSRLRRALYVLVAGLTLVLILFLPGPNGVVKILGRHLRAHQLARSNRQLESDIDSLRDRAGWLADPDSATELARRLLGADSTAPDSGR